jgi:hypothetical protein
LITGAPLGLKGRNALSVPIATGIAENSAKGFFFDENSFFSTRSTAAVGSGSHDADSPNQWGTPARPPGRRGSGAVLPLKNAVSPSW